MIVIVVFLVSLIPSVFYYFYLRNLKKDNEEYKKNCRNTLFRGLLAGFPIFILDLVLSLGLSALGLKDILSPAWMELIKCFVINAFVEELVKVSIGYKTIKKNRDNVTWLDMITYITISSIGFEILESAFYIPSMNAGQMLIRGLSMMHVSFGLIEGWYAGKYTQTGKNIYRVLTMAVKIIIHGLYNFGLRQEAPELMGAFSLLAAAGCLVYWIYMIFYIRRKKEDPDFTTPLYASAAEEEAAEDPEA
jgi:RsiW-degrading membrane proteinase PrsW (M82 family)